MPSTALLTSSDLDEIGCSMSTLDRPLEVAAELVDAVDQGRLADQDDNGYALSLAAEIIERTGDLSAAEVVAKRAVEAHHRRGEPLSYPRAFHAKLLLQLGRWDEAMAELAPLRPLLSRDPDAVPLVTEALQEGGQAEIAEQWLTAALRTLLPRREDTDLESLQPLSEQAVAMAFILALVRNRVRRDLGLPHDDYDHLSDLLRDALLEAAEEELPDEQAALLFWPHPEFEALLRRWPALAEDYPQTWEEYRSTLQQTLVAGSESGVARVSLLIGSVDELARYAERRGGDPSDSQLRADYAQRLAEQGWQIPWPPGRNHPCWCGSPQKYKKCCLPRSRT